MDLAQSGLTILTLILMIVALLLSIIPFVSGPLLLWGISIIYAILTGFQQVTVISIILISLLGLVGTTSGFWTPMLGMRTRDASCSSVFGTILGGLIGTFAIPVPLLGTLLGAIAGAILVEVLAVGDLAKAVRAGGFAFQSFIVGMVFEFLLSVAMIGVFVASILL